MISNVLSASSPEGVTAIFSAGKNKVSVPADQAAISNLVTNLDKIIKSSGLVPRHVPALQQVAITSGCVIAFRPVDPHATQLISEGYPTKNFHIKGKSSSWGPMAGFIPVEQSLSKLAGSDKVISFNQKVQDCLVQGHAVAGPLIISAERLGYLVEQGLLEVQGSQSLKALRTQGPDGREYIFEADLTDDGKALTVSHEGQAVLVLCDPASGLPLTADYDLMMIAPPWEQYGAKDIPPISDISHKIFDRRVSQYRQALSPELQALKDSPALFYEPEDKDMGNINQRTREMIPQLNQAMGCQPGRELVHHNMDATSPASDPSSNYPAIIIIPCLLDRIKNDPSIQFYQSSSGGVELTTVLVRDSHGLSLLARLLKDAGYCLPLNPVWEPEVTSVRRSSFEDAQTLLSGGREQLSDGNASD